MKFTLDEKKLVEDIRGLLRIDSTTGVREKEYPLGKGVNDAIDYVIAKGKEFGFTGENLDGYCGYVEMGKGEKMIGILAHVDTVPVDDNWTHPAFDCTEENGYLYGRGIVDDKGPAMIALHAMKALADSGIELDKRIRLIIGGDEEGGEWLCMKHYKEKAEMPTCAFSPDASYPATYAEKGILRIDITGKLPEGTPPLTLTAGNKINVVPAFAEATVEEQTIKTEGKPAHAMMPDHGISALFLLVKELRAKGFVHPFLDLVEKANVQGLNIALEDEPSGKLTINPAIAKVDGDEASLACDIRYPVTCDKDDILARINESLAPLGFAVTSYEHTGPLYVPVDSPLICTLQRIYKEQTGDSIPPVSTGGGTYARAFDNAVAFGVVFPDEEETAHMPDENWSLASIRKNFQIIANTLAEL